MKGFLHMNEILDIAKEIRPDIDWENAKTLMEDEIIDSFDVVAIAGELMETYDIEITVDDIEPENWNSIEQIYAMVQRKMDED